ncbi:chemotaxis-specific protein-glutamate methyltransferase CheB [Ohtaekwangia sp.]|uniref:chemotaxis-specific protein-glutamate methyltransferase CheB n=1 Tax=Ohtaekwangia sp. TaxID=2066019 RepID=UPI002FDEE460
MPGSRIKTLLIDDSGFMRIVLSDLLRKDETIDVVATACNGLEGVRKAKHLRPDVVITDMTMPEYDGLYVVQQLMKYLPLPIILLSSLERTNPKIFDALKEGAFDFVDKPKNEEVSEYYASLTHMVHEAFLADSVKLRTRSIQSNTHKHSFAASLNYSIITIGASTGGPSAIELIVSNLPRNISIPIVIAQHMPPRFIESFAARLADSTGLMVSVARDGEHLQNNHIYLAPGDVNVRIASSGAGAVIRYHHEVYKEFNCPSIDCLLESAAEAYGNRAIGVILTGMGRDGAAGLRKIREAGGLTITQDKDSSIVYGMPRAAVETGSSMYQVPLAEISNFIVSAL